MPVRVFDESGNTDDELVYKGIKYAIDNGCSVINMSFASSKYEPYLASLFQNTENPKFIASNGDFSANGYCYPATYEGVIPVSAIDEKGELYQYSNTATADQSIYAPGVDLPIVSVNINGDIIKTMVSGSSYATAIVSGIIGSLLLSNDLNEETLKTYDVYEDGFLNCNKLLKKAQDNVVYGDYSNWTKEQKKAYPEFETGNSSYVTFFKQGKFHIENVNEKTQAIYLYRTK